MDMIKVEDQSRTQETMAEKLKNLAAEFGTPILIIDHERIRENYREFKESPPRVQAYYAVKANSDPEIVKTLYSIGASFDVASFPEFMVVYQNIKRLSKRRKQDF